MLSTLSGHCLVLEFGGGDLLQHQCGMGKRRGEGAFDDLELPTNSKNLSNRKCEAKKREKTRTHRLIFSAESSII